MEKTEITIQHRVEERLPYMKSQAKTEKIKRELPVGEVTRFLAISAIGLLWGKVTLLQLLHPMGMAYLSIFFGESQLFWGVLVAVAMGTFLDAPLKAGACLAAAIAIQLTLGRHVEREDRLKKALLGTFATALAGMFYAVGQGGLQFHFALAAVESALVLGISLLGQKAVFFLWERRRIPTPSRDEAMGLVFLLGGAIAGLFTLPVTPITQGCASFLVAFTILLSVWKDGVGGGTTAGVLLGTLFYICGVGDIYTLGVLALSGMFAGMAKELARGVSGLFLLATPVIFLFYTNRMDISPYLIGGWIGGAVVYTALPKDVLFAMMGNLAQVKDTKDIYTKKKELVEERLEKFSDAFISLSDVFIKRKSVEQKQDISLLVDAIAENTCNGCGMVQYCWKEDLYQTYSMVFSALSYCESKGRAGLDQLPEEFRTSCARTESLVENINKAYEEYRKDQVWLGRLDECRELVGQQMRAVSEILTQLSGQMEIGCIFLEQQANRIKEECIKNGIRPKEVRVTEEKNGHGRIVQLAFRGCGGKSACKEKIMPIVRDILNCPMIIVDERTCQCGGDGVCRLTLKEAPIYSLSTAMAFLSAKEGEVSGDTSAFMETDAGVSMMAVSDGMGHGRSAAEESHTAIELLEQFTQAGFERELAIKMINSALLLRKGDDSYATLDICAVDLFDGRAEFIKLGAVSSFIQRGNRIFSISSHTLPAGILKQVTVEKNEMLLKDEDMVILMTDGVTDALGGEMLTAGWLKEKLAERPLSNPQDVAEYILGEAKKACKEETAPDDMMVVAGRFWKKRKSA